MESMHLKEDSFSDLKHLFPGESFACLGICWATVMTLLVLFHLSMIW